MRADRLGRICKSSGRPAPKDKKPRVRPQGLHTGQNVSEV